MNGIQVGKGDALAGLLGGRFTRLSPRRSSVEAFNDEHILEGVLGNHEQSMGQIECPQQVPG